MEGVYIEHLFDKKIQTKMLLHTKYYNFRLFMYYGCPQNGTYTAYHMKKYYNCDVETLKLTQMSMKSRKTYMATQNNIDVLPILTCFFC